MNRKIDRLEGLVVVTGASSGIGLELAKRAARDGVDLLLAADRDLSAAAREVCAAGANEVETVECDLGTEVGVGALVERIGERPVAALFANAGQGANGPFLDEDWDTALHIINTNVTGTLRLVHIVGRRMRDRDAGRIMVTGSIAGHVPGSFQLVYNSTKAFLNDFCIGLRDELRSSRICGHAGRRGSGGYRVHEQGQDGIRRHPAGRGGRRHAAPNGRTARPLGIHRSQATVHRIPSPLLRQFSAQFFPRFQIPLPERSIR